MRTGLKVSRGAQIAGVVSMIAAVVSCSNGGLTSGGGTVGGLLMLGFFLILSGRVYEWMTRE